MVVEVFLCSSLLPVWAGPENFLRPRPARIRAVAGNVSQVKDGGGKNLKDIRRVLNAVDEETIHATTYMARDIAQEAASILRSYRYYTVATPKDDGTLVTEADFAVQRMVFRKLFSVPRFQTHYIDAEKDLEQAKVPHEWIKRNAANFGKADFQWVVDPLDGTKTYAKRESNDYAFSLAVLFRGFPLFAVIVGPETGGTL